MEEKIEPVQRTEQEIKEQQDRETKERERLHKETMEREKSYKEVREIEKQLFDINKDIKTRTDDLEKHKVLLKFLWLNTTLLFVVVMIVAITLISVWITEMIAQILAFLFISLFGLGFWYRYDRQIRPLIK